MRHMLLTISTVFALVALTAPADAQFNIGAQGAVISGVGDLSTVSPGAPDLNNTYGLGARVGLQPPPLADRRGGPRCLLLPRRCRLQLLDLLARGPAPPLYTVAQPLRARRVAVASGELRRNEQHRERSHVWRGRPS